MIQAQFLIDQHFLVFYMKKKLKNVIRKPPPLPLNVKIML